MTRRDHDAIAVGQAVRGAIAQAGLSQAQAAEAVTMHLNSFSRRVNGAIAFTYPELVRIASATDVRLTDLVASAERIAERVRSGEPVAL